MVEADNSEQRQFVVQKRKLPRLSEPADVLEWPAVEVAADEFGSWLWCPQGTRHESSLKRTAFVMPCAGIQLLKPDGGWVAWWWTEPRWVSADVCDGPSLTRGVWTYTDLEVDVARFPDGTTHLLDEDELYETLASGVVSQDSADRAVVTGQELFRSVSEGLEPFGKVGWDRLDAIGV